VLPYLTLSGGNYYSPTVNVEGYTDIALRFINEVAGTTVTLQVSTDGIAWTDAKTWTLPTKTPAYVDYENTSNYVRVVSTADIEFTMLVN
jgi:hypothetical protein